MPDWIINETLTIHYNLYNPDGDAPVLLLHGLGATAESWGLQIPALTEAGFYVIAPDARGFGGSSFPGRRTTIQQMAGDMADLLYHLNIERAHVVGISMGGTLALQLAIDHPQMVEKLVLTNTFAKLHPEKPGVWLYFFMRFILVHTLGMPVQAKAVSNNLFPRPDQEFLRDELYRQILQADPQGYRAAMRALAAFDVVQKLDTIHCPTLVITSQQDTTVPPRNQHQLVEHILNSQQVTIPDAGHAVTAERPEVFNKVLLDFLKETTVD